MLVPEDDAPNESLTKKVRQRTIAPPRRLIATPIYTVRTLPGTWNLEPRMIAHAVLGGNSRVSRSSMSDTDVQTYTGIR